MDEPQWKPSRLELAIITALVVVVVIVSAILLGPQIANIFRYGPDNL